MQRLRPAGYAAIVVLMIRAQAAQGAVVGQVDTFEDGTTQNWIVAVGPSNAIHPAPPSNVATGGPAGANDNFMLLSAIGGSGPGSRLAVMNLTQWAGDYTAQSIGAISIDVRNYGPTALSLRLYFEDPSGGPPANTAISTNPAILLPGGGWQSVVFPIAPSNLTALTGNLSTVLSSTTVLRIVHSANGQFPGEPITAQLGVDNVTALQSQLPVPSLGPHSLALLAAAVAVAGIIALQRRGSPT